MVNRKVPEENSELLHAHDVVMFLFAARDGKRMNAATLMEILESKE